MQAIHQSPRWRFQLARELSKRNQSSLAAETFRKPLWRRRFYAGKLLITAITLRIPGVLLLVTLQLFDADRVV